MLFIWKGRGLEHVTPKYATLAYYFQLKTLGKQQVQEGHGFSFLSWRAGNKAAMWRSSLNQEKGRHSITRDEQPGPKKSVQTNLIKLASVFLVTSPHLLPFSQTPFVSNSSQIY